VDTYQKRKEQLSSQVFEQTDYTEYAPMRRSQMDFNNMATKQRADDHMFSDILGQGGYRRPKTPGRKLDKDLVLASNSWSTQDTKAQIKKDYTNYDRKGQKYTQLRSSLDTHEFPAQTSP